MDTLLYFDIWLLSISRQCVEVPKVTKQTLSGTGTVFVQVYFPLLLTSSWGITLRVREEGNERQPQSKHFTSLNTCFGFVGGNARRQHITDVFVWWTQADNNTQVSHWASRSTICFFCTLDGDILASSLHANLSWLTPGFGFKQTREWEPTCQPSPLNLSCNHIISNLICEQKEYWKQYFLFFSSKRKVNIIPYTLFHFWHSTKIWKRSPNVTKVPKHLTFRSTGSYKMKTYSGK